MLPAAGTKLASTPDGAVVQFSNVRQLPPCTRLNRHVLVISVGFETGVRRNPGKLSGLDVATNCVASFTSLVATMRYCSFGTQSSSFQYWFVAMSRMHTACWLTTSDSPLGVGVGVGVGAGVGVGVGVGDGVWPARMMGWSSARNDARYACAIILCPAAFMCSGLPSGFSRPFIAEYVFPPKMTGDVSASALLNTLNEML